jgi:protein O-GlcNAc transferase
MCRQRSAPAFDCDGFSSYDRSMARPQDNDANAPSRRDDASSGRLQRARRLHALGVEAAKNERWKNALHAFKEAVRLAPNQPGLHYVTGVALCRHDRFDEAIEEFREELRIVPKHGPALAEIGTCLARTGRTKEGIGYLQAGLLQMPHMPLAQYSLGLALLTEKRRKEAIEALDRAITLDGGYAEAYRTRGLAFAMDGQFDRSIADLRAAMALKAKNYEAIMSLGLDSGRERGDAHVARGFGLLGQGRVEEAVTAYRRGAELDPTSASIAGTLLFALQHKPGVTKAELLREHKRWAALHRPGAAKDRFLFPNEPDPDRRPRLGLVSADLHRHAVPFLTLRAFEQLVTLGYDMFCY